ncbi:MAG: cobalamin biosynthesis protein [Chloroflexi bacterium]|nr:cobalamin biosynthesis protein [Chloroflexota bacterium]
MLELAIFAGALALDWLLGEPPAPLHPVVWAGKLIALLERAAPRRGRAGQFLYGTLAVIFSLALFTLPAYWLLAFLKTFNPVLYVAAGVYLLKSCLSLRQLARCAGDIRDRLQGADIETARSRMRSLVSRDVSRLSQPLLVAATVESVAENTSDGFVAPLFYYLVFGVPGALLYRLANTWDSMIGYHGRYEYLGKFAARLDDVLNYVPARLTGILIVLAAHLTKHNAKAAWRVMFRDHGRTESPNAGWPMSAAAGALEAQLEKVGHYVLGDARQPLTPKAIDGAIALMKAAAIVWSATVIVVGGFRFGPGS